MNDLKLRKADIIYLQETHIGNISEGIKLERLGNFKAFWSFGAINQYGVGILINKNINFNLIKFDYDFAGRMLCLDVLISSVKFRFLNIYAPVVVTERREFFNYIYKFCLTSSILCLGGDFNCILSLRDKIGGNPDSGREGYIQLNKIIVDFNLLDVYRHLHPQGNVTTWRGVGVSTRIDRLYFSARFANSFNCYSIFPCSFSDHDYIFCTVSLNDELNIGPGFWKFNNSILDREEFVSSFREFWVSYSLDVEISLAWWEQAKLDIKSFVIAYCKHKVKLETHERRLLECRYNSLLLAESRDPGVYIDQVKAVKKELSNLCLARDRGNLIRAKAQYLENNETPSKYFIQKEHIRGNDKVIRCLEDTDSTLFKDTNNIKRIARSFYSNLFTSEPIDAEISDDFLSGLPQLSEESRDLCDGEISFSDVKFAVSNFKSHRSPGGDGLSREFYFTFIDILGPILVKLYNQCFEQGTLTNSQKSCIITLICKDKNNAKNMKFWRPISLLNVDYKILSKIIQMRLSAVLSEVVHPDQTCSVPGRRISDNLHLIRNIIDYINQKKISCALVNIDSAKAFDRVDHSFLFKCLQNYNFGSSFIKWVRLLYSDISSSVLINGFISDPFPVTRSVRQGCSLSPLLYVLVLEPFLIKIRNDLLINGLKLPGCSEEARVVAYADDVTGVCVDSESVKRLLEIYELFGKGSGAQLNKLKTKVLTFGDRWDKINGNEFGVAWPLSQKILGVQFGRDITLDDNWSKILNSYISVLRSYDDREFSLLGKSTIARTFAASKLWYVGTIIDLPAYLLKSFNSYMFKFIWGTKRFEPLKRSVLYCDKEEGGLKVVHILCKLYSFRLLHLNNMMCSTDRSKWFYFARYWLGFSLRGHNSSFGSNQLPHSDVIPSFYKGCLNIFKYFIKLFPDFDFSVPHSSKEFYSLLLTTCTTHNTVQDVMPNIDFELVWRNVNKNFIDPKDRSLAWRLAHDIVPTMWTLYCRHHSLQTKCIFCNCVESVEHLFYTCSTVAPIWEVIKTWVSAITLYKVTLNFKLIRFLILPKLNRYKEDVILLIINMAKRVIWLNRNDCKFRYKTVSSNVIICQFLERLRFRILVDRHRLSANEFYKYWLESDIFCCLDHNDKLIFSF
ncbi:hypothetical protein SNE40_023679 [Patella caerulea]|uniref:Reverse transcriptase domain-containing protein n=1 Tax=Patella caerulea TaxID=87958 RepID=A0AAN8FZK4_PATCE